MLDGLPRGDLLLAEDPEILEKQVILLEQAACETSEEALEVLVAACLGNGPILEGKERARLEKRLYTLLRRITEKHTLEKVGEIVRQDGGERPISQRITAFLSTRGDTRV